MVEDKITVVITSSPSRRHPDTSMIRRTIKLVRLQLPHSPIIILQDGIKKQQEYLTWEYQQYLKKLNKWADGQENIRVIEYPKFQHQTGMIRKALLDRSVIPTQLMLFVEHDFPVIGDIPWELIAQNILEGRIDLTRFYLEPRLEPAHDHLFLDRIPISIGGVPLIRTGQWSQRPHIASTDFYRRVVNRYIPSNAKNYIEDQIHGWFGEPFTLDATKAWQKSRLTIYHPEGSITRCKHLDGRLDEEKYDEET